MTISYMLEKKIKRLFARGAGRSFLGIQDMLWKWWRGLWAGRGSTLMGRDRFGNKYYRLVEKGGRERRIMRPPGLFGRNNPLKYDPDRVPAGWRSWLAFQRQDPPPPTP